MWVSKMRGVAAAALFFLFSAMGALLAGRFTRRIEALDAMRAYLGFVNRAVRQEGRAYPVLLADYAGRDDPLGRVCARMAELWAKNPKADPALLWRQAAEEERGGECLCALREEDMACLMWLGQAMAEGFPQGAYEHAGQVLGELRREAEAARLTKGRLCRTLCVLAGVAAAILIL